MGTLSPLKLAMPSRYCARGSIGGGGYVGKRLGSFAALKQQQAIIVRGMNVALCCSFAKQFLRLGEVCLDAPAEPEGLTEIELGIGVTLCRWTFPCGDSSRELAARPGIHSRPLQEQLPAPWPVRPGRQADEISHSSETSPKKFQ